MPAPRPTKAGKVRAMLARPQGARLDAICKATGWQPHSARAFLSGLRKAGYTLDRAPADKTGKPGAYRITAAPETAP